MERMNEHGQAELCWRNEGGMVDSLLESEALISTKECRGTVKLISRPLSSTRRITLGASAQWEADQAASSTESVLCASKWWGQTMVGPQTRKRCTRLQVNLGRLQGRLSGSSALALTLAQAQAKKLNRSVCVCMCVCVCVCVCVCAPVFAPWRPALSTLHRLSQCCETQWPRSF